jgi:hypothetical protein
VRKGAGAATKDALLVLPIAEATADWREVEPDAVSPAMRFVRLCGRKFMAPELAARLRAAAMTLTPDDWEYLPHVARDAGMAPLVYTHVAGAGLLRVMPAGAAAALADAYRHALMANRRMRRLQHVALEELHAAGVDVIPVKGITLASRYYGEIGLRPVRDIDLFVRRRHVRRACRVLHRLGYRPHAGLGRPLDFTALELGCLTYLKGDLPAIELHWDLPHRPVYRRGLAPAVVWSRAQLLEVDGEVVRCLCTADELRYLCIHCAADHDVDRLIWLVDIAELVRGLPADWSWDNFVLETVASGLATPVAVALAHCRAAIDLELPAGHLEALFAAARSPSERWAWATAHANARSRHGDLFSADGLWAHLSALGFVERAVFLRAAVFPRRWVLRDLYGNDRVHWRLLPGTYSLHWRRMANYLLRGWYRRAGRRGLKKAWRS